MKNKLLKIVIAMFMSPLAIAAQFDIPHQRLSLSLQDLARQSGTQIVFLAKLVEGRDAVPVRGDVSVEVALAMLLEGTALTFHKLDSNTIQIEVGHLTLAAAALTATRLDELEINGRDQPAQLRRRLIAVEDRFRSEYNRRNADHQFDLTCSLRSDKRSLIRDRNCQAAFVRQAYELRYTCDAVPFTFYIERDAAGHDSFGGGTRTECTTELADDPPAAIMQRLPGYQKNMIDVVRGSPELEQLLLERAKLARELEAVRRTQAADKPSL